MGITHTPDFGLSWNGGDLRNRLSAKSVDNTRLADIRITDQANTDLFSVLVKNAELSEEVDQGATTEGVLHAGSHGASRVIFLENADPSSLQLLASVRQ